MAALEKAAADAVWQGARVAVARASLRERFHAKGFGAREGKRLVLDLFEALFLLEQGKLEVRDARNRLVRAGQLARAGKRLRPAFLQEYTVFRDLRAKGYVVKTGFKFGFCFRVYPKGKRPGQAHTRWVVAVEDEGARARLSDLAGRARLAGTLRATLLLAVVDGENAVSYYELARWLPSAAAASAVPRRAQNPSPAPEQKV